MNAKRCWVEVDLDALRHNARVVREKVGRSAHIMAIVKANAYGHGMSQVATALSAEVAMFGVANLDEALVLRNACIQNEIYILGPALPEERRQIVASGFIAAISNFEEAEAFAHSVPGRSARGHLVIDTGMGRMGLWHEEAIGIARAILRLPNLEIGGVATHLPMADEDQSYTEGQLGVFETLLGQLREAGLTAPQIHVLNSAGVLAFASQAQTLVRAGLMLYGSSPLPAFQEELRPSLAFKTRVTLVRELGPGRSVSYGRTFITAEPRRVATIGAGYADGFPRHLSNAGEVLVGGRRCPVIGRVTMDQILVDVSALREVVVGQEVVLIGRQGEQEILAAELARKAGTIAWEIFTGIGPRVKSVYCPRP